MTLDAAHVHILHVILRQVTVEPRRRGGRLQPLERAGEQGGTGMGGVVTWGGWDWKSVGVRAKTGEESEGEPPGGRPTRVASCK